MTGLDLLGVEYGPVSPEQLAKLDRKLTPEEQRAVSEWQSKQSDAELTAERAKGGPHSTTVSVTPQGAVIRSLATPTVPFYESKVLGMPAWQLALLGVAGIAAGVAGWKIVSKPVRHHGVAWAR